MSLIAKVNEENVDMNHPVADFSLFSVFFSQKLKRNFILDKNRTNMTERICLWAFSILYLATLVKSQQMCGMFLAIKILQMITF